MREKKKKKAKVIFPLYLYLVTINAVKIFLCTFTLLNTVLPSLYLIPVLTRHFTLNYVFSERSRGLYTILWAGEWKGRKRENRYTALRSKDVEGRGGCLYVCHTLQRVIWKLLPQYLFQKLWWNIFLWYLVEL